MCSRTSFHAVSVLIENCEPVAIFCRCTTDGLCQISFIFVIIVTYGYVQLQSLFIYRSKMYRQLHNFTNTDRTWEHYADYLAPLFFSYVESKYLILHHFQNFIKIAHPRDKTTYFQKVDDTTVCHNRTAMFLYVTLFATVIFAVAGQERDLANWESIKNFIQSGGNMNDIKDLIRWGFCLLQ